MNDDKHVPLQNYFVYTTILIENLRISQNTTNYLIPSGIQLDLVSRKLLQIIPDDDNVIFDSKFLYEIYEIKLKIGKRDNN